MSSCIILFAKSPEAGQVKTRLQSHMTAAEAAELYRAFVLDCAEALASARADRKIVAYAPAAGGERVRQLLEAVGRFEYVAQPEGDLGERMARLMRRSFAEGASRTVIVGSDCPSLPPQVIEDGLELLRRAAVVLGPSTDGGYYLIGLSQPDEGLFRSITWSTGSVLGETIAALRPEADLALLPPWYDVDTPAEASLLRVHLEALERAGQGRAGRSLAALRRLDLPPPS